MRYRFMRVVVCFDLPTLTGADRRNYRRFRKFLLNEGFAMLQESVYSKLTLNATGKETVMRRLEEQKPSEGSVFVLTITEKQFANMKFLSGEAKEKTIQTDERLIII
jgi:CRISPR-associated protein Cas2